MSHVTTSAVVSTAGLTRGEISPQTQSASNERFQDFLKSYEHEQARAHAEVAQKTTANNSSATKTPAADNSSANQSPKTQSAVQPAKSVAQEAVDSASVRRNTPEKQPASTAIASSDTTQKSASAPSAKQSQACSPTTISQSAPQSLRAENTGKSSASERQISPEEPTLSESTPERSATPSNAPDQETPNIVSTRQEASVAQDQLQAASEPPADSVPSFSDISAKQASAQNDKVSEAGTENLSVTDVAKMPEPLTASENTSPAQTEIIFDENAPADPSPEASSTAHAENATDAATEEDHVSRHDEQQPLLYQKTNDGTSTTHIEMNIGNHEKVHVEIGETTTKAHRIHINTDNPEVYQSLRDNRESLLASLAQNSAPMPDLHGTAPADIQISLSTPSFLDMSSGDNRQGGGSHQPSTSQNASSANASTTDKRRILRGVIDLTV